jgi:hypothetical protein
MDRSLIEGIYACRRRPFPAWHRNKKEKIMKKLDVEIEDLFDKPWRKWWGLMLWWKWWNWGSWRYTTQEALHAKHQ